MEPGAAQTTPRAGRVGRPARISTDKIVRAAVELGLGDVTLRAVAARLGVSISSLYHHVANRDDLIRLAADYSAARQPLPVDHGQHWAVWLLEWAVYNRESFVAEPTVLSQFMEGGLSAESIAHNLDLILHTLGSRGFSVREAAGAYELVVSCAIGSAVAMLRERALGEAGRTSVSEHRRVVDSCDPTKLVHLRRLVTARERRPGSSASFEARIETVLVGIAVQRGDDPAEIAAALRAARRPRDAAARRRTVNGARS